MDEKDEASATVAEHICDGKHDHAAVYVNLKISRETAAHMDAIGFGPEEMKLALMATGPFLAAISRGDMHVQKVIVDTMQAAVTAAMADVPPCKKPDLPVDEKLYRK